MNTTISITPTDHPKPKPRDEELGFGRIFTDHMFLMDAVADQGWHNPRIVPYGPLTLDPSAAVFHYSQELFEGLKAYRSPRDTILLFRPDMNAARLNREDHYVRAVKGGMGAAKTGGNYAASLAAGEEAHRRGFSQVLWLDGVERKYIEEVGSMNIAFVIDDELVTPPLTGTILEGITRDTVLQLARDWGSRCGRTADYYLRSLSYQGQSVTINNGQVGPLAQRLFDEISAIQRGLKSDPHGWMVEVES